MSDRVRVLVVDDSAIAREILARGLSADPGLEVVGTAGDAYEARDQIVYTKPDVLTLDVEMPRMDGIEFLRRLLPQYPLPVVVVSALTAEGSRRAVEALEAGAVDVVAKPSARDGGLQPMLAELAERVKEASQAHVERLGRMLPGDSGVPATRAEASATRAVRAEPLRPSAPAAISGKPAARSPAGAARPARIGKPEPTMTPKRTKPTVRPASSTSQASPDRALSGQASTCVLLLGASTGGTVALTKVVTALPADAPGILIVQHMPPVFTRMFAESLDRQSVVRVKEAEDGDRVLDGQALVAPGDRHMRLVRSGAGLRVRLDEGPKVSGHRPSVDALFESAAEAVGWEAAAALLTGMGRDGAAGLLALRRAGARCLAQDEASSVVFGMPREAWELGAAESLVPLEAMARTLMTLARPLAGKRVAAAAGAR